MSVNLGRVAYVEKGAYDVGTVYQKKDVVLFNNGSYVFIADAPAAGILPTDSAYWQPMLDPTSMNQAAETANQAANAANTAAEAADNARLAILDELNQLSTDLGETKEILKEITITEDIGQKINAEVLRGFYNANSGIYSENNGYKSIKFPYNGTEKIKVNTYILANVLAIACFYDENDNFIGSTGTEPETKWFTDYKLEIPANTAYIAINCRYTGTEEPSAYVYETNYKIDIPQKLSGKIIVNFGDSIFGNYRDTNVTTDKSISKFIEEKTGATVYNAGFGGCRMSTHSNYWDAFGMHSLADSIASGSWSVQDNALVSGAGALPTYFSETVAMLKGIDWNEIDVITIGYGTNDYSGDRTTDPKENDPYEWTSFEGALRYSLRTILMAYPHLKVIVVSPMWRWFIENGEYLNDSDDQAATNYHGYTLPQFVASCEKIAKEVHVPYLDNYYDLGINKYNYLYYFYPTDGTHPNVVGRSLRADYIVSKLYQILGE